jgi:hypothetical protein
MSRKTVFCLDLRQSGFQTVSPSCSGNMRLSPTFPILEHGLCLVLIAAATNLTLFFRIKENRSHET